MPRKRKTRPAADREEKLTVAAGRRRWFTSQLEVNWIILALLIAILVICGYSVFEQLRDEIRFAVSVLAGLGTLIAVLNAIDLRYQNLALAEDEAELAREDAIRERQNAALRFVARWNHPLFADSKATAARIIRMFEKFNTPAEMNRFYEKDKTKTQALLDVLNLFEELAIAIEIGTADNETAKRFFKTILDVYYPRILLFIRSRQTLLSNNQVFSGLLELHEMWKAGKEGIE